MNKQSGSASVAFALLFGLLFLFSSGFGLWAFSERQSYKNDVDKKIDKAVVLAVREAETTLESEFVERDKLPTRTYSGSQTYGSLQFEYPKTWSVYVVEAPSGKVLDLYASPGYVPGVKNEQSYALRVELTDTSYAKSIEKISGDVEKGTLQSVAFRADKVKSVLGIRVDGEIEREKVGAAIYLPLRDKTIMISTQAEQFLNDFNTIVVPSISFIP